MVKERYCSSEVARLLKEKGFNEPIWTRYEDDNEVIFGDKYDWNNSPMGQISAPTHQMACDWLMTKGIYICPTYCCFQRCKKNDKPCCKWEPTILSLLSSVPLYPQLLDRCEYFDSFSDAVDFSIKYSLENLI